MKTFSELAGRLKKTKIDECRKTSPGYLELVLSLENLKQVYPALEEYFGPPFKPAGVVPTKEALLRSEPYGGIEKQQILYYVERDGVSNCAMIWPWQDKTHATVKVAQGELSKKK